MTMRVLTNISVSLAELKANPINVVEKSKGEAVAVLNGNKTAFYCVPVEEFERMIDKLEDLELLTVTKKRESEESISVNIDDL
ncbi:type II toxin-antitoxin system Phd/YefM family antitoxin [Photobacterium leiognathi]|uniref:type II toxin-antitoxin system Phd/YefM family antitoxin n=1 Tax=Photobacterium leiognathi TaxID=553611 RepID=UPI002981D460|nr:type II toxin-antitoxin system Phd/YefM family antitoxin [Photobacterium leiognathi]